MTFAIRSIDPYYEPLGVQLRKSYRYFGKNSIT